MHLGCYARAYWSRHRSTTEGRESTENRVLLKVQKKEEIQILDAQNQYSSEIQQFSFRFSNGHITRHTRNKQLDVRIFNCKVDSKLNSGDLGIQIICSSNIWFLLLTRQENIGHIVHYSDHYLNNRLK